MPSVTFYRTITMDGLLSLYHVNTIGLLALITTVVADTVNVVVNQTLPVFLPAVTNISITRGSLAVLPCSIQNLQDKQVVWRYVDEDKFLTIGKMTWFKSSDIIIEHLSQADNISNWDLLIKNTRYKYSGIYECQITSTVDLTRKVQLNIIETTIKGESNIDRGDKIYLLCNVTGGPHLPNDITWYKDGHRITTDEFPNVIITKYLTKFNKISTFVSEIIVDKSVFSDTGVYTCRSPSQDAVKAKIRLQIGDTVHVKRIPVFEDLKKQKIKQSTPIYKSGWLQTVNSSGRFLICKYLIKMIIVLALLLWKW